jgi:hypothetical protein
MPGHTVGIEPTTFGILAPYSYSPEYITPTQKKILLYIAVNNKYQTSFHRTLMYCNLAYLTH